MAERERAAFDEGYETAQGDLETERDNLRDEGRDNCAAAVRGVLANYRDGTADELANEVEAVL